MTNDQFKLLLYGSALCLVAFTGDKKGGFGPTSSPSISLYPQAPNIVSFQQSNTRSKTQDSPWLWIAARPQTQQIVQKDKKEEIPVGQQLPKPQPAREGDKVYNEPSSTDGVETMEKMRQFRLERHEEDQADPVRL